MPHHALIFQSYPSPTIRSYHVILVPRLCIPEQCKDLLRKVNRDFLLDPSLVYRIHALQCIRMVYHTSQVCLIFQTGHRHSTSIWR